MDFEDLFSELVYNEQEQIEELIAQQQQEIVNRTYSGRYVFLSYPREDEELMLTLFYFLLQNNILVYCDQHIPAGVRWTKLVKPVIQNSACLVVLVTSNTENADGVEDEIVVMIDAGKKNQIIPVMVRDGDKRCIPYRIVGNNRIDLRGNDWESQFNKLVASIQAFGA